MRQADGRIDASDPPRDASVRQWQIVNTDYFAPLVWVNKHGTRRVTGDMVATDMFASLSNWLLRPVPTVTAAVQRARQRCLEDNYVIGNMPFHTPSSQECHVMRDSWHVLVLRDCREAAWCVLIGRRGMRSDG